MESDPPADFTSCEPKAMLGRETWALLHFIMVRNWDGHAFNSCILTSYISVHNHCFRYSTTGIGTSQIKLYQRSKVYAPYTVA